MTVREGTAADRDTVRRFYEAYFAELWDRPWTPAPPGDDWLEGKLLLIAEDDGTAVGGAVASIEGAPGHLHLVYVDPGHRRRGVARALLRAAADWFRAGGAAHATLNVDLSNAHAIEVWRRLGFTEVAVQLTTPLDELGTRLADHAAAGPSIASIHVQTDDVSAVEGMLRRYVPRGHTAGTALSEPHNGWLAVYDDLCDRDPAALRRLARELSTVIATVVVALALEEGRVVRYLLVERGSVVDEYLSVPEHYGPLPPGDVVGLGANPTAVARLTGADPARVRQVARTAATPEDLPPPAELLAAIADAIGLEGGEYGYGEAVQQPGVNSVEHG
jgi:ribosomal protein S18 acetylase RimI-like enzyme